MKISNILQSQEDLSKNFVFDNLFESRFVRRVQDYFIVYLSSHTGCNKACRFCHLTQTKQTDFTHADLAQYLEQADHVLNHYQTILPSQGKAQRVNYNFMARGEALSNNLMLQEPLKLFNALHERAKKLDLEPTYNISTIMPDDMKNKSLVDIYQDSNNNNHNIVFYYSLYSVNEQFRKRWLPKSLPVIEALDKLKEWQSATNKLITFHWTFIENENDSVEDIEQIIKMLEPYNFNAKFNLVRYNPYSPLQGRESEEAVIERNFKLLSNFFNHPDSRIVPRVGFDVKASCGMFVSK